MNFDRLFDDASTDGAPRASRETVRNDLRRAAAVLRRKRDAAAPTGPLLFAGVPMLSRRRRRAA